MRILHLHLRACHIHWTVFFNVCQNITLSTNIFFSVDRKFCLIKELHSVGRDFVSRKVGTVW
jgi:hypothetical protein